MNSSLEAICAGIGRGASFVASRSHWRTHMVVPPERRQEWWGRQECLPHRQPIPEAVRGGFSPSMVPVVLPVRVVMGMSAPVVVAVVVFGGRLDCDLGWGVAHLPLQPAGEQGEASEKSHAAELPP